MFWDLSTIRSLRFLSLHFFLQILAKSAKSCSVSPWDEEMRENTKVGLRFKQYWSSPKENERPKSYGVEFGYKAECWINLLHFEWITSWSLSTHLQFWNNRNGSRKSCIIRDDQDIVQWKSISLELGLEFILCWLFLSTLLELTTTLGTD